MDVTVVMAYSDHEEVVGSACMRLASHLRDAGLNFELLAVEEGSRDNSASVLALLRSAVPELRLLSATAGAGWKHGGELGRARVVWLIRPEEALRSLRAFQRAHALLEGRQRDLVAMRQGSLVLRWAACRTVFDRSSFPRRSGVVRRASSLGLSVEHLGNRLSVPRKTPWLRVLRALEGPKRIARHSIRRF